MYYDCLFIGHNEINIDEHDRLISKMGKGSGGYRDFSLSVCEVDEKLFSAMDLINFLKFDKESIDYRNDEFIRYSTMSYTIEYLGTYINKAKMSFDFINMFNYQKEELADKLKNNQYLAIIIPTTLYMMSIPIIEVVKFVKKYNNKVKIIIGGPFIYTQNQLLDKESLNSAYHMLGADYYIVNTYGEEALTNLILALKNNQNIEGIKNIAYEKHGKFCQKEYELEDINLSNNMVNWTLFSKADLGKITFMRTSLSCPFSCAFCGFPERAGNYRCVEIEKIEENLNLLQQSTDIEMIHFMDDTFNIPKQRFKELLEMMIENKYRFKWNSTVRCQFLDEEVVALMKKAGCIGVFLGIESGSNKILQNMNKHANVEDYRNGIGLLKKYEIMVYTSFIIGFPGETKDTIKQTIDFIEECKPDFYRTQLWYCDPITPIYKEIDKYKIKGSAFNWKHETMDVQTACKAIEDIFIGVENSIWLPQYSFEVYGVYELIQKGIDMNTIKKYIKEFNKLVALKLNNDFGIDREKQERIVDNIKEILNIEDKNSLNELFEFN